MWTRENDPNRPGKFAYTIYTPDNVKVEQVGGFATAQEADRAAEGAQRLLLVGLHPLQPPMTLEEIRGGLK